MTRVRFVMLGGFLGAGKTTAIARLARHYTALGKRVGIVTNDQAYDLVDTHSLRGQGFDVGEVPGACFCCKFNDLVDVVGKLRSEAQSLPEVIVAEPVGSCTDLVATVIEPLRALHGGEYEVAPLAVLLKPEHGLKILSGAKDVGFSPKAAYIFLKQIEEADIVAVNKIDKLGADRREELLSRLTEKFPEKFALAVSAKTGEGFETLIEALERQTTAAARYMEVDYDVYAEGEAELGWLNCQARVESGEAAPFSLDDLLIEIVSALRDRLASENAETAHLKILAEADGESAIANYVGAEATVDLSLPSGARPRAAHLIVNARVACDPELLEKIVTETLPAVCAKRNLICTLEGMQRFRPGRPTPTHRLGA
jgi:G3E family GTPase